MANLFLKNKKITKSLLSTPFNTEEEFEKIVFETPEILEDIFFLKRQIRGGSKNGIPDIIGIDSDGNVCIVEMKNVEVDASIIKQVLEYAFWAETNPDSIKALWLEAKERPENLSVSWDDFEVKIIIIAPTILHSTLDIIKKINYPVELVEIKRWVDENKQFLLVNKLEEDKKIKPSITKGLEVYDKSFYLKIYNKNSVSDFLKYIKEVESIVAKQKWPLETKYNKHYCGFKAGFFNAFGVKWIGSKTFAFFFKISQNDAKKIPIKMTRYDNLWKEAVYYIEPGKTQTKKFIPLFNLALKKLSGK